MWHRHPACALNQPTVKRVIENLQMTEQLVVQLIQQNLCELVVFGTLFL